ncbi:MAG TPA: hypothetical protein VM243_19310, partial [Phycisphaerae bacterium]|nr:hypothetical protein [Phycisphaerae bacterium]
VKSGGIIKGPDTDKEYSIRTKSGKVIVRSGWTSDGTLFSSTGADSSDPPVQIVFRGRVVAEVSQGDQKHPGDGGSAAPGAAQLRTSSATSATYVLEPHKLAPTESAGYPSGPDYANTMSFTNRETYDEKTKTYSYMLTDDEVKAMRALVRRSVTETASGRSAALAEVVRLLGEDKARGIRLVMYDGSGKAAYCWPPSR